MDILRHIALLAMEIRAFLLIELNEEQRGNPPFALMNIMIEGDTMIKLIWTKMCNSRGRLLLLLFSLVLSTLFLSMGVQLYKLSTESIRNIEESTTTLALISRDNKETVFDLETYTFTTVSKTQEYREMALRSPTVISPHPGTTLVARMTGGEPVLPSHQTHYSNNSAKQTLRSELLSGFLVRIDRIDTTYHEETPGYVFLADNKNLTTVETLRSDYQFTLWATVLDVLVLNDQLYEPYDKIKISTNMIAQEGLIFEEGKEYAIFGHYSDPVPINGYGMLKQGLQRPPYDGTGEDFQLLMFAGAFYDHLDNRDLSIYSYQEEDGYWSQYILAPQDIHFAYIADDARIGDAVCWAELNNDLLSVTGISTLSALPIFAMNEAYLVEGRDINKKDVTEENQVCIISTAFAKHNKLEVGDEIHLEFFSHELSSTQAVNGGSNFYYFMDYYNGSSVPEAQRSYTIVGTYQTTEWVANQLVFSPNTVLVPESTLPLTGQMGLLYADSLILRNGSNEQFLSDIEAMGIPPGTFMVYDGGYTEFMDTLKVMHQDGRIVMIVCILLCFVVTLFMLYMMVSHLKQDAAIMKKVGASNEYTVRYMLGYLLPVILLSTGIAYSISCVIYMPLIEELEKWYTMIRPAFSNLPTSSEGMLTNTINNSPTPTGAIVASVMACIITIFLTTKQKEVSGK